MDIDVGQIIAGKYELQRLLGKGAMGEVWLAHHNSLGGEFAVKLVEPTDDIEAETAAGRFQLEAQIAAKLSRRTRHIVSVSDHGEENGLAYLVMECLEGESLEARVKRMGTLDLPEVAAIVMQVARALQLAHDDGIFHRDLKPANVFLTKDEDGRLLVKLLDFGIARTSKPFRTRSPFATSKDMVLGTPSYMSPEQARGLETLDYRCDLWALAVVAYEALTRRIPFEGETVEDIFLSICTFRVVPVLQRRANLPPELEAFFARAFAPKLEDRFASAAELTEALESLVGTDELEAAIGVPPRSERNIRPPSASRPELGSNPQLVVSTPNRELGNIPSVAGAAIPIPLPPPSSPTPSALYIDQDPKNDPTPIWGEAGSAGKRRRGGWIFAVAGGAGVLALLVFFLVAFRNPQSKTTGAPTPPPETTTANTVVTPSAPTNTAPARSSIELTDTPPSPPAKPIVKAAPPRSTTAAATAAPVKNTPVTTSGANVPVTTAGTVAPTPPIPAAPKDKSGVF